MMALITQFIPLEWIISGLAVIGAGFVAWLTGRRGAKQADTIKALEKEVKGHEIRNEVENRIASERDARRKLHDNWAE